LQSNHDVIIADTPEEIAEGINRLYNDAKLWNKLSKNGQEAARKYFSMDVGRDKLVQLMTDIGVLYGTRITR